MKPLHQEEIDLDFLRESNLLAIKWAEKCNIMRNAYMDFAIAMAKNPDAFAETLSATDKKEFSKDRTKMFYAFKVEDQLIRKFHRAVYHVMKRFRVKNKNLFDDLSSLGFQTVRSSIWRYSKSDVKLSTFVFNGLICAYRGMLSHRQVARNKKKNFISFSAVSKDFEKQSRVDLKAEDPAKIAASVTLPQIIKESKLTADEVEILEFFMSKGCGHGFNWCTHYQNSMRSQNRKVHHRSVLQKKVVVIKRKIARRLNSIDPQRFGALLIKVNQIKL